MLLYTQFKLNTSTNNISTFHYDLFWTVFDDNKTQTFNEYIEILFGKTTDTKENYINIILSDLILKNEHIYIEDEIEIIIKKYQISHLSVLEKEIENILKSINKPSVFENIFKNGIEMKTNINKNFDKYRNKNISGDLEIKNKNVNRKIIYTKYINVTTEKIDIDYFCTILDIEKKNNLYIKDVFEGSFEDYEKLIKTGENIYSIYNVIKIYSKLYNIEDLDKIKKMNIDDIRDLQLWIDKSIFPDLQIHLNEFERYDKIRNTEI